MPRKLPDPTPCRCGCGELTPRDFRQGHDMRVPLGAPCSASNGRGSCRKVATFAVGRAPSCASHLADVVLGVERANGHVRVRILEQAAVPDAKPTTAPRARKDQTAA